MDAIIERCCGIDVHKQSLTACLLAGSLEGKPEITIKTFSTMTNDLLQLKDWLEKAGCTHIAIESTGVYWKPVFNLLEESLEVVLVNARDVKNVPGRKTDVKDCQWLAQLLRCGLLKPSFIPEREIRELRDLTRYRRKLTQDLTAEKNRVQKVLEDANIKLSSVATDIFGVSGRIMMDALLNQETAPEQLAELAKGRLRNKIPELVEALTGNLRAHHRFMIEQSLQHIAFLTESIARLDVQIDKCMAPFRQVEANLKTIPGVKKKTAEGIVAEIGVEMEQFPTAAHLASWAGMAPGNNESAGKRRSGHTTHGDKWLRTTLVEAAWAASKSKGSYFKAQYHRLAGKRGKKRALVAVGHSILTIAYYMIKNNCAYKELGEDYFDQINHDAVLKRQVKRLEKLGYKVTLEPVPQAA